MSDTGAQPTDQMPGSPSRVRKWVRWVQDRNDGLIYRDVVELLIMSRQIWRRYQEILFHEAPQQARKNATFDKWVSYNYIGAVGVAVRRQTEPRNDRVSLGRLLQEIHADGVTKLPHGSLTPGEAAQDLKQLRADTKVLVNWVNRSFAHSDPQRRLFDAATTVGDIDKALDAVFTAFNKYRALLVGAVIADKVSMSRWEVVFSVPWLPERSSSTST